jgi:hypothetical protein
VDLVPVEREVHEFVGIGVLIAPVPDVLDLPDPRRDSSCLIAPVGDRAPCSAWAAAVGGTPNL